MYDRIMSSGSNQAQWTDRMLIQDFLMGKLKTNPWHPHHCKARIVLNETARPLPDPHRLSMEYIIFEMDFRNGKWRKLRRTTKRLISAEIQHCETDENVVYDTGIWDANGNRVVKNNCEIEHAPLR